MVSQDVIAQLRQDITTAEDAGDTATSERLRGELSAAMDAADRTDTSGAELPDLTSSGSAPQPAPGATRRAAEDLGPGSYEQNVEAADEQVQEPPD
ncbi:hypothetical protein DFR70_101810 [Nocardia tenerifensis]|uniref:Uncharacterized protein n=1 Tax=Nocardia tenerifensis TaxID=228006 RepID=A0A318KAM8_9NOCA|nr:hypothetical protein [Nocardia tenerifensis]PXX71388.1 hypothetical protein DFR70_101810 [Nocardia tenerifensis]